MNTGDLGTVAGIAVFLLIQFVFWPWVFGLFQRPKPGSSPSRSLPADLPAISPEPHPLSLDHSPAVGGLSVKWTNWAWHSGEISREYSYRWPGDHAPTVLRVMARPEQGDFGFYTFWNFYLTPSLGQDEGHVGCIVSIEGGATTGFFALRAAPIENGPTLLNVPDRELTLKLNALFLEGRDLEIQLGSQSDPFMLLPVPNDDEFRRVFEPISSQMKAAASRALEQILRS